jgi:hypothetical protein
MICYFKPYFRKGQCIGEQILIQNSWESSGRSKNPLVAIQINYSRTVLASLVNLLIALHSKYKWDHPRAIFEWDVLEEFDRRISYEFY